MDAELKLISEGFSVIPTSRRAPRHAKRTCTSCFTKRLKHRFAEKKILSALPKMAKAAQSEDLKAAFEKHGTETEEHVARLEKVFEEIEQAPQASPVTRS